MKPAKKSAQPDLSEYAEEAVPFDEVIKRLGHAKALMPAPPKAKAAKPTPKRKPRG